MNALAQKLKEYNIPFRIVLKKTKDKKYVNNNGIELTDIDLSYNEVLDEIKQYKCLLELTKKDQCGLTVRTLESLFYNRKLITNNKNIINFSFYDQNNIYILEENMNYLDLKGFLESDCKNAKQVLLEGYSLKFWLNTILTCSSI